MDPFVFVKAGRRTPTFSFNIERVCRSESVRDGKAEPDTVVIRLQLGCSDRKADRHAHRSKGHYGPAVPAG